MNRTVQTLKDEASQSPSGQYRDPVAITVPAVSRRISMGLTKTWALVNSGEIPSITIGRSRRVLVEALEEWLDQKENTL